MDVNDAAPPRLLPPAKKQTKTKTTRNDATPSLFPPVLQSDGSIEEWQQWGNRKRFRIYIVLWHAHINAPQWWRDDIVTRTLFPNSGCLQVERSAICPPPTLYPNSPTPPLPLPPTLPPPAPLFLADFSAKHITFVNYLVYWPLRGFNMKVVSRWQSECRRGPQVTWPRSPASLQLIIYLSHAVCSPGKRGAAAAFHLISATNKDCQR